MRHPKRKIVFIIGIITLSLCISTVFGAFIFSRIIDGYATTGKFYEIENEILNYSPYANMTKAEMDAKIATEGKDAVLAGLNTIESTPKKVKDDSIVCYATRRTGTEGVDEEYYLPNLNQLGFSFKFTTTIDAYVRISFEDAWISKKTYFSGKEDQSYIIKDQLNGSYEEMIPSQVNESNFAAYYKLTPKATSSSSKFVSSALYFSKTTVEKEGSNYDKYTYVNMTMDEFDNNKLTTTYYTLSPEKDNSYSSTTKYYKFTADSPFKVTDADWYYDAGSNIAYYKKKIDVDESNGGKETFDDFDFKINSNYFYKEHAGSFYESVKVQLSYHVDVVQANRAFAIWGVDPERLV